MLNKCRSAHPSPPESSLSWTRAGKQGVRVSSDSTPPAKVRDLGRLRPSLGLSFPFCKSRVGLGQAS